MSPRDLNFDMLIGLGCGALIAALFAVILGILRRKDLDLREAAQREILTTQVRLVVEDLLQQAHNHVAYIDHIGQLVGINEVAGVQSHLRRQRALAYQALEIAQARIQSAFYFQPHVEDRVSKTKPE